MTAAEIGFDLDTIELDHHPPDVVGRDTAAMADRLTSERATFTRRDAVVAVGGRRNVRRHARRDRTARRPSTGDPSGRRGTPGRLVDAGVDVFDRPRPEVLMPRAPAGAAGMNPLSSHA